MARLRWRGLPALFGILLIALIGGCEVKSHLKANGQQVIGKDALAPVKPAPTPDALQVVFGLAAKPQFAGLRPGDTVTVKGTCSGSIPSKNPTIVLAQIYTGPDTGTTAVQIMKEYAGDAEATRNKYFGKEMICQGVVVEVRDYEMFLAGH
jgi:hypothetical protein